MLRNVGIVLMVAQVSVAVLYLCDDGVGGGWSRTYTTFPLDAVVT